LPQLHGAAKINVNGCCSFSVTL